MTNSTFLLRPQYCTTNKNGVQRSLQDQTLILQVVVKTIEKKVKKKGTDKSPVPVPQIDEHLLLGIFVKVEHISE